MSTAEGGVGRDLEIPLPARRRVFVRLEELPSDDDKPGRRVRLQQPNAAFLRVAREYDTDPAVGDHHDSAEAAHKEGLKYNDFIQRIVDEAMKRDA